MTAKKEKDYIVQPFPRFRIAAVDLISQSKKQHNIHGLSEIDITKARKILNDYKQKTGEKISFTGFIIKCLSQAVDKDKSVQAYKKGKKKLVIFDDVDVNTMIERIIEGVKFPWTYIIRSTNTKSLKEIHNEIRSAQVEDIGITSLKKKMKFYTHVPKLLRNIFWHKYKRNPHIRKKMAGTVSITSIGMFGKKAGWGIPIAFHTLVVTIGGISEKVVMVENQLETREFINITFSFDHDIVDGAPAARFIQNFTVLVEEGFGLEEMKIP